MNFKSRMAWASTIIFTLTLCTPSSAQDVTAPGTRPPRVDVFKRDMDVVLTEFSSWHFADMGNIDIVSACQPKPPVPQGCGKKCPPPQQLQLGFEALSRIGANRVKFLAFPISGTNWICDPEPPGKTLEKLKKLSSRIQRLEVSVATVDPRNGITLRSSSRPTGNPAPRMLEALIYASGEYNARRLPAIRTGPPGGS